MYKQSGKFFYRRPVLLKEVARSKADNLPKTALLINNLEQQLDQLRDENERLRRRVNRRAENRALRREKDDLQKQLDQAQRTIRELRAELSGSKLAPKKQTDVAPKKPPLGKLQIHRLVPKEKKPN